MSYSKLSHVLFWCGCCCSALRFTSSVGSVVLCNGLFLMMVSFVVVALNNHKAILSQEYFKIFLL